jgi:hypothetical protein
MKGPILDALNTYCPKLRELEINGRHQWNYEPEQLTNLRGLESIALLMPNGEVVSALVNWCEAYGDQLKELTLICKVCLQCYSCAWDAANGWKLFAVDASNK